MQPTRKITNTTQTISFSEGDGVTSSEVYATDVVVTTNAGNHNHGSSKFKLKSLVDYNWEPKFYPGQLLAVHLSGKYLAYCIKAPNANNPGTWNGMVRVVYHAESGTDHRTLIKGMKGEIQDLDFAHIHNQVVLACIDEFGNFYVYEIEASDTGLRSVCVAEVREDTGAGSAGGAAHRVVWCPYIPDDEDDDDDVARLLLTTHANIARMWNVRAVSAASAGAGWSGASALLAAGAGRAAGAHAEPLTAAAFSPDGTALATAAMDGYVMFAQVYMNNENSPRCLHKWQPHDGKPLSCLFFLDNHKSYNPDEQFWKFAVTGADNNTSIKIWTCKSWECLQTITFQPTINTSGMKAMLDSSASYLLLSDFDNRSLYVLNMIRDSEDTEAYCKSISEFLLPYPVLSFCIVDAEEQQAKSESRCDEPFHRNGNGDDSTHSPDDFDLHNNGSDGGSPQLARLVRVRLYIVQPKGLQEGTLLYAPPAPLTHIPDLESLTLEEGGEEAAETSAVPSSILQQQTQQLKNLLMRSQTQPGSLMVQRPESPAMPSLNLMTPDAFSSPSKRDDDDPPLSATPEIAAKARLPVVPPVVEEIPSIADSKQVSGGSSPSLEVQQIMGHSDETFFAEMEDTTPTVAAATVTDGGSSGAEPLYPPPAFAPPEPSAPALPHPGNDTSWPKISLAHITEANQRKASSDKSSNQSVNTSLNSSLPAPLTPLAAPYAAPLPPSAPAAPPAAVPERLPADYLSKARLDALEQKLDSLMGKLERVTRLGEAAARAAGGGAARALEPLAAALQHELAAKLSATDDLLRANIDKLAGSKTIMEKLSSSIAASLADMVRAALRDALFESAVPVMEKAHAQIFKQINQAFQNGTKEYCAHTETAARAAAERGAAAATAALRAALDAHAEALAAATRSPLTPQAFAKQLQEVAHAVLEKEMTWWREQARAVQMSRTHSPATPASTPAMDRQMQANQILAMINRGEVNAAFQTALSAADLALVVAACRGAEPARVFGPPCRLRQPVLLSLVQQLAADMAHDTALKHRYLEEAIMNLDTSNQVTREHLPVVIRELQKQIVAFLNANPGCALGKQFKMLLMATESLVKSV
ncbi:enhancer of mRNA-decapping protein 4-like [Aricia agestis]|uniref:enhancer of mRNA-decapping protein 4-like n=1 Tax=Aricia agestis TaxID=91739 RepID=UPI001C20260F|nr:enhancer of mRNA-decapping protein 4-like [Aricia agestis]